MTFCIRVFSIHNIILYIALLSIALTTILKPMINRQKNSSQPSIILMVTDILSLLLYWIKG